MEHSAISITKRQPPIPLPTISSCMPHRLPKLDPLNYYLTWNTVGTVSILTTVDGKSIVKIQFHDTTHHSSILLQNNDDYGFADISNVAVCLASTSTLGLDNKIYCVCFLLNRDTDWTKSFSSDSKIQVKCHMFIFRICAVAIN
ncbi:hypothetical protein MXB_4278 [Myxobolus squamalis]|nr:hypothetical protein MXB_4278 [Myxobolus squamalis]